MDPRMLRYYSRELAYLREMGAEFAGAVPEDRGAPGARSAPRWPTRTSSGCSKGFSFLAARVQLKLDAEFPRFTQHLLEIVYPHYLAPTPAMAIVQFVPTWPRAALASGFVLPRGTVLRGQMPRASRRRASSARRTT